MEPSASTQDALVRPWRTATIVASLVAVIELVLIAVFASPSSRNAARLGPGNGASDATGEEARADGGRAGRAAARSTGKAEARPHGDVRARPQRERRRGAAASTGEVVRNKGYVIAAVGNAACTDYRRSVVMYRPGYAPEAARFARDLRVRWCPPSTGSV